MIDNTHAERYIVHDIRSNTFTLEGGLEEFLIIDLDSSVTIFNSTAGNWETNIRMWFTWDCEEGIPKDIVATLKSDNGHIDTFELSEAYVLENDIVVKGEPIISSEDPTFITSDDYVRGGTFLKISGISVTFHGTDSFYPHPDDIDLGIVDSTGKIWDYDPSFRSDLSNIHFSFLVPKMDGPNEFTFKVLKAPASAEIIGNGTYKCTIDSTPPVIGDMKTTIDDKEVTFNVAIEDLGSGPDLSTLRMKVVNDMGHVVKDWSGPQNLVLNNDRVLFSIDGLEIDDYEIMINIGDKVNNKRSEPRTFFFSTFPSDHHDISIDGTITVSMDPVIENNDIHFRSIIINRGNQDEKDLLVEVLRNDEHFERISIDVIPAGSSREITWKWTSTQETSRFHVTIDPLDTITETNREDNIALIDLDPEYRDLTARADYILPSKWDVEEGEVVSLSLMVKNIGSIGSRQFKVQVLEDGSFIGQYMIPDMDPDSSYDLSIDWVVNFHIEHIQLKIDPFNEIPESVKSNNLVDVKNPFYQFSAETDKDPTGEDPVTDRNNDNEDTENIEDVVSENGGTTWSGPVDETEDKVLPIFPMPFTDIEDEPPMTSTEPQFIPLIIPSVAITFTLLVLGSALVAFRFEPLRYKWLILFIPLYSKLKRSKIEKGVRFEILGYLKARPGANYTELKKNLDLNDGTLVHHLRILEREEKISSKKLGKYKLFYADSYRRQTAIDDYISPFHKRILEIITKNPGIVPTKLSTILDRSQTDISYHLSELLRNGYLEKKKKGRNNHYYINQELVEMLSH